MRMIRRATGFQACVVLLTTVPAFAQPDWIATGQRGMVASDSPEASRVGADVLAAGGNAFDAAIATSFALTVTRPQSTGIGGGGFMVAYIARTESFVVLDFREMAPEEATPRRYEQLIREAERHNYPSPSELGGNAVGVPGLVAGLSEIHRRYATRPWLDLVQPSIELARNGFVIDQSLLGARRSVQIESQRNERSEQIAFRLRRVLGLESGAREDEWEPGKLWRRERFARALHKIAIEGRDGFYRGAIADDIVKAVEDEGGALTTADLLAYPVIEREPLRFRYMDYEFVTMPPPSSGGVALAQIMQVLEHRDYGRLCVEAPAEGRHVLIEAMKHAFADRARWMGDPDYVFIPVAELTSPEYTERIAGRIDPSRVLPFRDYGTTPPPPDDSGTSHFSIADAEGNVVAITETINGVFGSYILTPEFGIILNNEMDDFLIAPGRANLFGLRQGEANLVAPFKRPLSSMTPTIVLKDGKPIMTLGASGGPRIITAVAQVALAILHGVPHEQAMSMSRLHHQWSPGELFFDSGQAPEPVVTDLITRGHVLSDRARGANVQIICFLPDGRMLGMSDPRKGGRPAGVD